MYKRYIILLRIKVISGKYGPEYFPLPIDRILLSQSSQFATPSVHIKR